MGLNLKMFTSGSCSQTFISVLFCFVCTILLCWGVPEVVKSCDCSSTPRNVCSEI
jgi:hypothetical protein